jgi:hypothetical protein
VARGVEQPDARVWYRLDLTRRYQRGFSSIRVAEVARGDYRVAWCVAWTEFAGGPAADVASGEGGLEPADWTRLEELIAASRFWDLPAVIRPPGKGYDGPSCELSGGRAGRVHTVWRYQPDEAQDGESIAQVFRLLEGVLRRHTFWLPCL